MCTYQTSASSASPSQYVCFRKKLRRSIQTDYYNFSHDFFSEFSIFEHERLRIPRKKFKQRKYISIAYYRRNFVVVFLVAHIFFRTQER